ncbi:MAG: DNA primase DnaG [Candidatus Woesearchaeota archaeon]
MGKISPVSSKYIVHSEIQIEGVVDRPDVIGAIFGQTEGLLGSGLELRELQRSGRIGRIDVRLETISGKTEGAITVPSSLDKTETVIIAAALETIQRIGPCNASVKVDKVEDVRVSKRNFVISRAKELLKNLTEAVLPDSQEITEEVSQSVRLMEVSEYGKDRLSAGPNINDAEEIIVVEGRADVLTLLKNGIKNCISMDGTSVPQTIIDLCEKKIVTVFVDGDRGGDLIIKELLGVAEIDYVIKAPDGKEVEELAKKEIHKALRGKIAIEQFKLDLGRDSDRNMQLRPRAMPQRAIPQRRNSSYRRLNLTGEQKSNFKKMLDDLVGTRGAYLLDQSMNILGKVPGTELIQSMNGLNSVFAVVFDGAVSKEIIETADRKNVKCIVGMNSKVNPEETRAEILTNKDFQ